MDMIKRVQGFRSIFTFLAVNFLCSCGNTGSFSIEGIVKNKNQGKDGYTAYIVGVDKKLYTAVVSRVNMANTLEYQEIAIGDEVKVYGDSINLNDHITIIVTKKLSKNHFYKPLLQ